MREHDTLRSYQYDAFGNRIKKVEGRNTTSSTFNALNQLISKHDNAGDNYDYIYDGRGNMSEMYKNGRLTHKHHFGALNRLESVFNYEQGKAVIYDYNGLGNRIGKRIGLPEEPVTSETNFHDIIMLTQTHVEDVIDVTKPFHNLLRRTHADVVDAQLDQYDERYMNFTYDYNVLSAQNEKETVHYFHDELSSPLRLINDHGHERDRFDFDEFGNSLRKNHSDQPFTYTGYHLDPISDTLLSPSRAYDPKIGRFISEDTHWNPENMIYGDYNETVPDPLAIAQSNNLYSYTVSNPINYVDPLGRVAIPWWLLDGLFYPGEVHRWVSQDIVSNNDSLVSERRMIRLDRSLGRVDLVDIDTGVIFEIKPITWSDEAARDQLQSYVGGSFLRPNLRGLRPQLGSGVGYNFNGNFEVRRTRWGLNWTYHIAYSYSGNGVITYSYAVVIELNPEITGIGAAILGALGTSGLFRSIFGNDYEGESLPDLSPAFEFDELLPERQPWMSESEWADFTNGIVEPFRQLPRVGSAQPTLWDNIVGIAGLIRAGWDYLWD